MCVIFVCAKRSCVTRAAGICLCPRPIIGARSDSLCLRAKSASTALPGRMELMVWGFASVRLWVRGRYVFEIAVDTACFAVWGTPGVMPVHFTRGP